MSLRIYEGNRKDMIAHPQEISRLDSGMPEAARTPKHWVINNEFHPCQTPLPGTVLRPTACSLESDTGSDIGLVRGITTWPSAMERARKMVSNSVQKEALITQVSTQKLTCFAKVIASIGSGIRLVDRWNILLVVSCIVIVGFAPGVGSTRNSTHPYGDIGYGYDYGQGVTNYGYGQGVTNVPPCRGPLECALFFNTSDPLRDAILLEEESETSTEPCIVKGHLAKSVNWYGYLATLKLRSSGGKIFYRFVYPEDRCCIKILIYLEEQVLGLRARMNCLQKQSMVDPRSRQVILLSPYDSSSGCVSNKTENGVKVIECTSGRVLKSNEDRNWYIAASSCGSPTGLDLQYYFVAYGHKGKCPEPDEETNTAPNTIHDSASFKACFWLYTLMAGFYVAWRQLVLNGETSIGKR